MQKRNSDSASKVIAGEAISALMLLVQHQVDLVSVHRVMKCTPDVTRRPLEVCPRNARDCNVFGVTWWPSDDRFAGYSVCLAHDWAGGPYGPGARQLPTPYVLLSERSRDPSGPLALVPQGNMIAWAVVDDGGILGDGCQSFRINHDHGTLDATSWLNQLFLSYMPEVVLITTANTIREQHSEDERLKSVGIVVKTTTVDGPVESYRDFIRMERLIGIVLGISYAHCSEKVYVAPELRLAATPVNTPQEDTVPPEVSEELFRAASSAIERLVEVKAPEDEE